MCHVFHWLQAMVQATGGGVLSSLITLTPITSNHITVWYAVMGITLNDSL